MRLLWIGVPAGLVVLLVVAGVVVTGRPGRRCVCSHRRDEHDDLALMGIPCTACRTCVVFAPARWLW